MLRRPKDQTPELRSLAMALLVSFAGVALGIFFLSFTYKQLMFVWFGLAGAMYRIVKQSEPSFEVEIGWKDVLGVISGCLGILALIYVYTPSKREGHPEPQPHPHSPRSRVWPRTPSR